MLRIAFLYLPEPGVFKPANSPMGIAYIAAYLERELGLPDSNLWIEIDVDHLIASQPDMVGICSYSWSYTRVLRASEKIKQQLNVPIILGGPHITAMPQSLGSAIDIGVLGEGEVTMRELVQLYLRDEWNASHFAQVQSIVFHTPTGRQTTPKRPTIQDLDSLPKPKRAMLKAFDPAQNKYIEWFQGINTSRGCPFVCQYCVHSTLLENVRYHSTPRIVDELLEIIHDYPHLYHVTLHDELFALSKKRLREWVMAMEAENIPQHLAFNCMTRANVFDEEIAQLMKRMNMEMVGFGFETNAPRVLKFLKVGKVKISDHYRALKICEKYELNSDGYFIIGSPIETLAEMAMTYWFIYLNIPPMMRFELFRMTPFPGNALWQRYVNRGVVDEHMDDWEALAYSDFIPGKSIFVNEQYSPEEFVEANVWFENLKSRSLLHGALEQQKKMLHGYQDTLWPEIRSNLTPTSRIQEITWLRHGLLERQGYPASQISPMAMATTDLSQVDVLLLNHVFEKLRHPTEWLQQLGTQIAPHTQIICLFYNGLTLHTLNLLLQGQWRDPMKDFPEFDHWKLYSRHTMMTLWQSQGFRIRDCLDIELDPLKAPQEPEFKLVYELLAQAFPQQIFTANSAVFSHVLSLTPIKKRTPQPLTAALR